MEFLVIRDIQFTAVVDQIIFFFPFSKAVGQFLRSLLLEGLERGENFSFFSAILSDAVF